MTKRLILIFFGLSVGVLILGGVTAIRDARSQDQDIDLQRTREPFTGWSSPNVALVVTGQQHGYIEPCGCTGLENQKGGLARRATCIEQLRNERGWNVVPIDAGNLVRRIGPQPQLKYQQTVAALRRMGYQAVGFGPDDLRLSFTDLFQVVIDSTDADDKSDLFVSANADLLDFVRKYRVIESGGLRIGVTSVLADDDLAKIPAGDIVTSPAVQSVRAVLTAMRRERCDFTVVMAQMSEAACQQLTRAVPGFDLVVSADGTGEPRFQPIQVNGSAIIKVGAKGMYVGVVGLYRQPNGKPKLRYERLSLDASFDDSAWVLQNMAEYQRVLKTIIGDANFANLGIKPTPHIGGEFIGSEACGDCHTQAYDKWLNTPHHHATISIAEPTERSSIVRHYDPECLSCHVTGWEPQQFRPYQTGYLSLESTPHMTGSGCENCHGPGKTHVDAESGNIDVSDSGMQQLRKAMRLELKDAEKECMKCHDLDNSPDFHKPGAFEEYWEQVAHPWMD